MGPTPYPLHSLLSWAPFRIDALGLITMIGSEQVDSAIGRLVFSRVTEYLPLLGAFIFASDQFADARSGFAVYNLSAGITTTDVAGWFSRWCTAQRFERSGSEVRWNVDWADGGSKSARGKLSWDVVVAVMIGVVVNALVIAVTVLQGDWWGFANAMAMIVSVGVRAHVLRQSRIALDVAVEHALRAYRPAQCAKEEKILVVLADARMVSMYVPSNIVYSCFVSKPEIQRKSLYYCVRMIGWAGFAVQVVALGMSGLATQIITVSVMVSATIMTHFRVGSDDSIVGSRLHAERYDYGRLRARRKDVYVALELERHEEHSMLAWNLMPHKTSPGSADWWAEYEIQRKEYRRNKKDIQFGVVPESPCSSKTEDTLV